MEDNTKCSECGSVLDRREGPVGVSFQCLNLECGSTFAPDEIYEDAPAMSTDRPMGIEVTGNGPVTIPRELFDFLMGAGEIDGASFGDNKDGVPGRFWWRTLLREADRQSSIASPTYAEGRADVDYWNSVAVGLGHESVCEALEALERLQSPPLTDAPDAVRAVREALSQLLMPPFVVYDETDEVYLADEKWTDDLWESQRFFDLASATEAAAKYGGIELSIKAGPFWQHEHPGIYRIVTDAISSLTTPPAKDDARRLREALKRIVDAPMIDHRNPENSARNIAIAALSPQSDEGEERHG